MRQIMHLIFATVFVFFINQAQATDLKNIEQNLSDAMITTKITTKFAKNKNLNPLKILVSTQDGIVTLHGHAKNKQAFVDALRIAKTTHGVKAVDTDNLDIKLVNSTLTDAYITAKIETAVLKAKVLDDESIPIVGINASTVNGIVTLTGVVKSNKAIVAILKRVHAVKGVKKIISNLRIEKGVA